ncbi:MAG: hypothetical protein WD342_08015 [Verrucomicrobiales bacterium]
MIRFLYDRPWIWIVLAFLCLIASWVVLLRLANEKRPAAVTEDFPSAHERSQP